MFRYEIKKMLGGRVLIILAGLLVLNILFFYSQHSPHALSTDVQPYIEKLEKIFLEQLSKEMDSAERNTKVFEMTEQFHEDFLSLGSYSTGDTYLNHESIKDEIPPLMEKYSNLLQHDSWMKYGSWASSELLNKYKGAVEYKDFLKTLQQQADTALSLPIFSNSNSFSNRNLRQTVKDFAGLEAIETQPTYQQGIVAINEFYPSDVLSVLGVALLCMQLFERDKQYNMDLLLRATPYGRRRLCYLQLLCVSAAAAFFTLLLQLSNITMSQFVYGLSPLQISVQSMLSFRNTIFTWTVGEYLIIFVVFNMVVTALACVLATCFSRLFQHKSASILVFAGLYGMGFMLWTYLPQGFISHIFRYLNPFGLFDSYTILADYQNLNLFGFPANLTLCAVVVITVLVVLCMGYLWASCGTRTMQLPIPSKLRNMHIPSGHCGSTSLFVQECYHFLWLKKSWLWCAVALILFLPKFDFEYYPMTGAEIVYRNFVTQYGGAELTPEQCAEIEQLHIDIENVEQRKMDLQQAQMDGSISPEELEEEKWKLFELSGLKLGFPKFYEQYQYVQQQQNMGRSAQIVQWNNLEVALFRGYEKPFAAAVFLALLVGALSAQYGAEHTSMSLLQRSTPKGRMKHLCTRATVAGVFACLLLSAIVIPHWINMIGRYGTRDFSASIYSIPQFSSFPLPVSIAGYLAIAFVMEMGIAALAAAGFSFLCSMLNGRFLNVTVGVVLFIFPSILMYLASLKTPLLAVFQTNEAIMPLLELYTPFTDIHTILSREKWHILLFWMAFALITATVAYITHFSSKRKTS